MRINIKCVECDALPAGESFAMRTGTSCVRSSNLLLQGIVAIACAAILMPREFVVLAQGTTPAAAGATDQAAAKLPPEQLDSLVAPIALYPDELLAQTLVAATYPLEIIQLQQWLLKNPGLKDKALADAVAKQPWDPAIQSMAAIPDVVKRLADDVQWTTDLGNAFLAQQGDVMDAVQRMRKKAADKGALVPNEQQKVETQVVEGKTVIVVESANPEVVYVPSYSPTVVYGAPYYPYPPIYYPPYVPGTAFVAFSFGVMVGAAWGGYCCGMGWGHNDIDINVNNNFNQINHNRGGGSGGNTWQHNPQHRGAAPYGDRATASKYGGAARGESPASRQASARQQPGSVGDRSASPGVSDRSAGGARGDSAGPGTMDRGGGGAGPSSMDRGGGGGADRVGDYKAPSSNAPRQSGMSGGSGGYNGNTARANSSRGASSMGGRGGGGGRRR
jgi:hypothetical protein